MNTNNLWYSVDGITQEMAWAHAVEVLRRIQLISLGEQDNLDDRNRFELEGGHWAHCEQVETGGRGTLQNKGTRWGKRDVWWE